MTRPVHFNRIVSDMAAAMRPEAPPRRVRDEDEYHGPFEDFKPNMPLILPHPTRESHWYKGLLPWLRDFGPHVRAKMFLIASAWEPVGGWDPEHNEWSPKSDRVVMGSRENGLYTPVKCHEPDVVCLWRIALDVPLQSVGVFAMTNAYARDKLLRLLVNVRQVKAGHQLPLVEEIFRNTIPRPEQMRPKHLAPKAPWMKRGGKW